MKLKLMTYNIAATRDFGKGTGKPFEYAVEKYAETPIFLLSTIIDKPSARTPFLFRT